MTLKEKILAEIERRQEYWEEHNFHSMVDEYDSFWSFVNSVEDD